LIQCSSIRTCGLRQTCSTLLLVSAAFFVVVLSSGAVESHPLYAKLLGRLDANHLSDGKPFFAKTSANWKDGSCTLKAGTVLEGVVVRVLPRDKNLKHAEMDLRFHPVYCDGDELHQVVPLLVATEAPHQNNQDENEALANTALANTFANMVASHIAMRAVVPAKPAGVPDGGISSSPGSMSGGDSSDETLRVGEMRGFSKVKLSLPMLVTDPTILTSANPLLVDRDTRFALILRPFSAETEEGVAAASTGASPASSATSAKTVTAPAPKPVVPAEAAEIEKPDVEICVETGCAAASNVADTNTKLERTVPLHPLGYRVRANQVLRSLADDAAVAFVGENQVLVTFNPHPLVRRSPSEANRATEPRIIRAALISAATGKVLRESEWRVPERGPYLWALDQGRVLARTANALTIFGPGLAVERQWTPPGSVRFVRISPSRSLIVVGVERERHSSEEHLRLAEFLGPERSPDEDEDLTLLDEKLKVLGTEPMDAIVPLPAVLDSGVLLSNAGTRQKWVVQQLTWDHKKQTIVHVSSSCPLRMDTLPTNLIVLTGCAADGNSYWYKVVRPDGKTLLTGTTSNQNWVEAADAPSAGKVFAIGIAEASRPVDFGAGMLASDFNGVTVSVYRSSNGQRLFATRSSRAAVNRHSFALSPTGDTLAILSGDALSLYRIADTTPESRKPSRVAAAKPRRPQ
jgi:hypothetical protein